MEFQDVKNSPSPIISVESEVEKLKRFFEPGFCMLRVGLWLYFIALERVWRVLRSFQL